MRHIGRAQFKYGISCRKAQMPLAVIGSSSRFLLGYNQPSKSRTRTRSRTQSCGDMLGFGLSERTFPTLVSSQKQRRASEPLTYSLASCWQSLMACEGYPVFGCNFTERRNLQYAPRTSSINLIGGTSKNAIPRLPPYHLTMHFILYEDQIDIISL